MRTKWVHMSLGTFKAVQDHLHSARTPDGRADREHIQGWTQTAGVRGGKNVNHEWTMNVLSHEATAAFLQRSYSEQRSSLLFSQELISVSKEWTVKGPVVSSISLLCRQMGPVNSFNPVLPTVRVSCSTFSLSSEGRFTFSPKVPPAAKRVTKAVVATIIREWMQDDRLTEEQRAVRQRSIPIALLSALAEVLR